MKYLLLLLLTSCTASFQPWPGATQKDLAERDAQLKTIVNNIAAALEGKVDKVPPKEVKK